MFCKSVIVLAVLSVALGYSPSGGDVTAIAGYSTGYAPYHATYHGPPAPLNHDGTVANTPEVNHAIGVHKALYAREFERLHAAASLAAAHPDLTSPSYHYGSGIEGSYNYRSGSQDHGDWHAQKSYGAVSHYNYQPASSVYYGQGLSYKYNPQPLVPAPLNHDGTVANTPEVDHAIGVHKALYAQEFQRLHAAESLAAAHPDVTSPSYHYGPAYSHYHYQPLNSFHYDQGSSYQHSPEAHIPAPLNHDGTVAHTSEYKAIAASHHAENEKARQRSKYHHLGSQIHAYSGYGHGYY